MPERSAIMYACLLCLTPRPTSDWIGSNLSLVVYAGDVRVRQLMNPVYQTPEEISDMFCSVLQCYWQHSKKDWEYVLCEEECVCKRVVN